MSRKEEIYKPALIGKNIPILTLDNKWHRLFTQTEISPEIKIKEQEGYHEKYIAYRSWQTGPTSGT